MPFAFHTTIFERSNIATPPQSMISSYIPQRVKRAKQQITIKLYHDQLKMLDSYGRYIDDSREYIISQVLYLVFKKDKGVLHDGLRSRPVRRIMANRLPAAMARRMRLSSPDHGRKREKNVFVRKLCWIDEQSQPKGYRDGLMRRIVESRNFISFVLSATIGLYLFRVCAVPGRKQCASDGAGPRTGTSFMAPSMPSPCHAVYDTLHHAVGTLLVCLHFHGPSRGKRRIPRQLSLYPDPEAMRKEPFPAIGEIHNPRQP